MITFEPIGGGLSVAVNESCRFTEDAILLAKFSSPSRDDTACDLGAGSGIIPMLWCRRDPPARITAVEREDVAFALLCETVDKHGLRDRITPLYADWNDESAVVPHSMSLVTCNPPYFPFGASRPSADPVRDAARREDEPDLLGKLCRSASRIMTENGRFCVCHRPERLADVFTAFAAAGLVPTKLQLVQTQENTAPWLFLCEAKRRGVLRVLPTLLTAEKGTHTDVYKRLYR